LDRLDESTRVLFESLKQATEERIPESILETREDYLTKAERIRTLKGVAEAPTFHRMWWYGSAKYVKDCFGNTWRWSDYFRFGGSDEVDTEDARLMEAKEG
jgi:hypothetical protein